MNIREIDRLRETYRNWVDSTIMQGDIKRQPQWTESIAVGNKVYVEKVKDQMWYKAVGRRVIETEDSFVLKEMQHPYQSVADKATDLQPEDNTFCWQNRTEANLDSNKSLEGSFWC